MTSPDHLAEGSRVRTPWLMVNALGLYVFVIYGITYYVISAAAPRMAADLGVAPRRRIGRNARCSVVAHDLALRRSYSDECGRVCDHIRCRGGSGLRDPRQRRSRALGHPQLCNMARSSWHGPANGIGRRSLRPRVGIGACRRGQRRHDVRDDSGTFCGMLRRARMGPTLSLRTASRCKRPALPTAPFKPLDHAD